MSAPYPTYEDEVEASYREGGEYNEDCRGRLQTCYRCGEKVWEEDTIDGSLCRPCAKEANLAACDHCGRAVPVNILVAWEASSFCKPCARELERRK